MILNIEHVSICQANQIRQGMLISRAYSGVAPEQNKTTAHSWAVPMSAAWARSSAIGLAAGKCWWASKLGVPTRGRSCGEVDDVFQFADFAATPTRITDRE